VPTGFGVLLGPVLLIASLIVPAPLSLRIALALTVLAAAAYWWDDAVELRASVRLAIAVMVGMGFAVAFLFDPAANSEPLFLTLEVLLAGIVCACVVNMVNFYDGADLNLATFLLLTAAMLFVFAPGGTPWIAISIGTGAFAVGIAVWNQRPRTMNLGDAGSFVFGCLLVILGLFFVRHGSGVPPEAAIPVALPAVDVAYVFVTRVREKHDLLTRNYLHLYQQIDKRYSRFAYLLPQFANVVLCIGNVRLLEAAGIPSTPAVIGASALTTVIFYAVCRWAFVPRGAA
jgi:UDP-N-acetylmuramyl pentapeptide phosphotransferase/UDP-N-acetylglucosamine-1-phosphate transferase